MNVKTKLIDRLRPVLLGVALLSGAVHAAVQPLDRVVAIVDNDVVMQSQLDQRVHEVQQTIAKRGGGLHHLCVRVSNIDETMTMLKAKGVTFIDAAPRQGAHGSRIAFLHPSSAGGLLLEIKEIGHRP